MASNGKTGVGSAPDRVPETARSDVAFERKVRRARWIMYFEQLWLRLWLVLGVGGIFVLLSIAGVWSRIGDELHWALLAAFGIASMAAVVYAGRTTRPSREAALRRIETTSGIPHRPASSYEDTLTASAGDPTTRAIWSAHRARMSALRERLKTGKPHPRTDRHDPFAFRALGLLALMLLIALAGTDLWSRLGSAFRMASADSLLLARLDAWVTPPAYTGRPPLMLADGANPIGAALEKGEVNAPKAQDVPERSVVIVRASGLGSTELMLKIPGAEPGKSERIVAETKSGGQDVQELRYEVRLPVTIRVLAGNTELASWPLNIIPDEKPKIAFAGKLTQTPRGSMKLTYKVEDDYGVAAAEVKLEKLPQKAADPAHAWARPKPLTGPRPPLVRPPQLLLKLPQANAKSGEASTYLELASHPWAGMRVRMLLEAQDVAGQKGRSESIELVLPERQFKKPLARAVVEQRRKLIDDPRYRDEVRTAVGALTIAPERFIEDLRVYLGLRSIYHRLDADKSRAGLRSVIGQLWHIALRIEDGDLSDAERRLREAQDKLAKALEEGASEEEIARLMQELKDAFRDFARQMAEKGRENGESPQGNDQDSEQLSQEQLDEMLKNLEEMAKSGSREEAMKMLSELQDLMERMQSAEESRQQSGESREMMKMMEELSSMLGEQQQLMDDTFNEQRKEGGEEAGEEAPGQSGKRSSQGQRPGQKGQKAQRGKGQPGRESGESADGEDSSELGQGEEQGQQGRGRGQLGERQKSLKERLARLKEEMREKRAGNPDKLDPASEAMENAEQALENGDFDRAVEEEGRALDEMRQSAQELAEQMLAKSPGRYGQKSDNRDPLGRPQRTHGPDLGTSVKVPSEIDRQRAREILEELRRRLGEATRPAPELDYLERLEKRF
jgi:uncharacterized protein (TIGR02302 family)